MALQVQTADGEREEYDKTANDGGGYGACLAFEGRFPVASVDLERFCVAERDEILSYTDYLSHEISILDGLQSFMLDLVKSPYSLEIHDNLRDVREFIEKYKSTFDDVERNVLPYYKACLILINFKKQGVLENDKVLKEIPLLKQIKSIDLFTFEGDTGYQLQPSALLALSEILQRYQFISRYLINENEFRAPKYNKFRALQVQLRNWIQKGGDFEAIKVQYASIDSARHRLVTARMNGFSALNNFSLQNSNLNFIPFVIHTDIATAFSCDSDEERATDVMDRDMPAITGSALLEDSTITSTSPVALQSFSDRIRGGVESVLSSLGKGVEAVASEVGSLAGTASEVMSSRSAVRSLFAGALLGLASVTAIDAYNTGEMEKARVAQDGTSASDTSTKTSSSDGRILAEKAVEPVLEPVTPEAPQKLSAATATYSWAELKAKNPELSPKELAEKMNEALRNPELVKRTDWNASASKALASLPSGFEAVKVKVAERNAWLKANQRSEMKTTGELYTFVQNRFDTKVANLMAGNWMASGFTQNTFVPVQAPVQATKVTTTLPEQTSPKAQVVTSGKVNTPDALDVPVGVTENPSPLLILQLNPNDTIDAIFPYLIGSIKMELALENQRRVLANLPLIETLGQLYNYLQKKDGNNKRAEAMCKTILHLKNMATASRIETPPVEPAKPATPVIVEEVSDEPTPTPPAPAPAPAPKEEPAPKKGFLGRAWDGVKSGIGKLFGRG